jgi:hypothetical protein
MCPKRLPEPANAGPLAGGRRASSARSGRARVTRLRVSVFSGATAPQGAQRVQFVL